MFHFLLCLPFNPLLYLEVGHELVSTRQKKTFQKEDLEGGIFMINSDGGKERRWGASFAFLFRTRNDPAG